MERILDLNGKIINLNAIDYIVPHITDPSIIFIHFRSGEKLELECEEMDSFLSSIREMLVIESKKSRGYFVRI